MNNRLCNPLVSILMPVRNESAYIQKAIVSILEQDYPLDRTEIFIIDGDSDDKTREIILEFQKNWGNIFLLSNPQKIVSVGMNLALPKTKGEVILRVDGHCIIDKNYIQNCVNHILLDSVDGVGGPMQTIGETPLSNVIAIAMSSSFGVGGSAFRTISEKTLLTDTVPFPAYIRAIILKAGLYDEELVRNQDDEYNYRIRKLGGKILLAGDIKSKYYSRGSLDRLWKQYYQYGYWKVRVLQKHPRQMSSRQFVPPTFVAALLTSIVLSLLVPWGRILFIIIASSYLLANLISSLIIAIKKGWSNIVLLPVTFLVLHLSYGLGFLAGLFRFWNRWGDRVGKVPEWVPSRD